MLKTQKKLVVQKLSTNFRSAVTIETCDTCMPKDGEICIRNKYVGITAADIHITKHSDSSFVEKDPPFDCGLQGIGHVVAVGKGVSGFKIGDPLTYIDFRHSAFAEYTCVQIKDVYRVPELKPEYLALCASGITALTGIEKCAKLKKGEKVLITGASGGLGHLAVQIAKNIGCYVVATCSMETKVAFLKDLGCDRVINYGTEDLDGVLSKEFPDGMDAIFETIGGPVFEKCFHHIATKGRLVIMGVTSGCLAENKETFPKTEVSSLNETIFYRGASIIGGFVDLWFECWEENFERMLNYFKNGEIKVFYNTSGDKGEFIGMEGIIEAMEYFFQGKHTGKIIATIY